ncbi:DMT family transporter [Glycomyces buryatensis]|uniref:DMT family transporter n=1 Tax=Glycomyces buryatensis TaxID=2570927 RepID=A0A4S8PUD7_9ACTN|nr:DMT family transporter [Glycomyces buryatensis]THV33495.1 DMT family transporter [Glycomyces buryatensis]
MRGVSDRVGLALFVGVSIFAGGNAVGIRFSNRELDPLWGASLRFGAAALLLMALMSARRLPMPHGRALAGAIAFGLLNFGVTFSLAYYALVYIHAGLGQTILSMVPLVTLLLSVGQRQEQFRPALLVGVLFAAAGVAVISQAPLREAVPLLALLAVLGAVMAFAEAAVLAHRLPRIHPITLNAVGMTAAAIALFAASFTVGDRWELPRLAETWWALAYLVFAGSVLTFVFYVLLIGRWGASRTSYVFVVIPVVTIMLSAWLDDEPLTWSLLLGAPLILFGVYLGALRPPRRRDAPTPTVR